MSLQRIALVLFVALIGCNDQEHDSEVRDAHERFVAAVKSRDAGRVFELSQPELAQEMDALHKELSEIVARIHKEYPKTDRDVTLSAVGGDLLKGVSDGRELFIALIDFETVRCGADVDRGLAIKRIDRDGDEAVVETLGGETFRYVLSKDGWRCTAALAQLQSYPSLKTMRHNIGVAAKNLDTWSKAAAESIDPMKPEGAFNIVAAAVKRGARVMIFELLDKRSQTRLKAGFEVVQRYQEAVEKRFPKGAARREYLTKRGIGWTERVADARTLFAALWDAKIITKELEIPHPFKIEAVRPGADGVQSVIVLQDGQELSFAFRRALSGRWMLAHLEPALEREVARKLEAELLELPSAPGAKAP